MPYELEDEDVTFAFTPEMVRKTWKVIHGKDIPVDDETLRNAAHEVMMTQFPELISQIAWLATEYDAAMVVQRMLREEWMASPEADPDA